MTTRYSSPSWEAAARVARDVAPHLVGYTVDDELDHHLRGPNGGRLIFHVPRPSGSRVEVSGAMPDLYKQRHTPHQDHRIGVSAFREPASIAEDIQKRLLPGYVAALGRAVLVVAVDAARDAERHALAERIMTRLPHASAHDWREGETTIHAYLPDNPHASSADIRLAPRTGGTEIKIWGASIPLVNAIVDLIAEGDTAP